LVRTCRFGTSGLEKCQQNQTGEAVGVHGVVTGRESVDPLAKLIVEPVAINKNAQTLDLGVFISSGN
jgi:hypothetical protein